MSQRKNLKNIYIIYIRHSFNIVFVLMLVQYLMQYHCSNKYIAIPVAVYNCMQYGANIRTCDKEDPLRQGA